MEKKIALLSRKYATAFVNVFAQTITIADVEKINKAIELLDSCDHLNFFLEIPYIQDTLKHEALADIIIKKAALPTSFDQLIALLISHKRSSLIVPVLKNITELLMEKKNIQLFTISSSHELRQAEIDEIKQFLAQKTAATIIAHYTVDKKLIAGLRLQSNTYLWEHSLYSYLNRLSGSVSTTKD